MLRIRTERLLLRDFLPGDRLSYQADPRYLEHYEETPDEAAIRAQARAWASEEPRLRYQLAVVLEGQLIGCVGARGDEGGCFELGAELDPGHWGRGYATEAMRGLLDWLGPRVRALSAETAPGNERAHRLAARFGVLTR